MQGLARIRYLLQRQCINFSHHFIKFFKKLTFSVFLILKSYKVEKQYLENRSDYKSVNKIIL